MRALILASALAALAGVGLVRADEKKEPAGRPEQLTDLQKETDAVMPGAAKAYGAAKTEADKHKAIDLLVPVGEKLVKLVEADPKDATALKAASYYMQRIGSAPPTKATAVLTAKVLKAVAENHADAKEARAFCQMAAQNPTDDNLAFLKTVLDKAKEPETKAAACYGLATALAAKVDSADTPRDKAADAEKQAKEHFERVIKDYADVTNSRGKKLGDVAKDGLERLEKLSVGKPAPDASGEDLDGKKQKLSDFKGKVVVVDIWATWCPPCVAMIPHERELVERMKDRPFVLLSVSADDKKETLTKFLEEKKMPWAHWWNGSKGNVLEDFKVEFYPTIYVLDAKGVIRYKNVRGEDMDKAVEALLKEMGK